MWAATVKFARLAWRGFSCFAVAAFCVLLLPSSAWSLDVSPSRALVLSSSASVEPSAPESTDDPGSSSPESSSEPSSPENSGTSSPTESEPSTSSESSASEPGSPEWVRQRDTALVVAAGLLVLLHAIHVVASWGR